MTSAVTVDRSRYSNLIPFFCFQWPGLLPDQVSAVTGFIKSTKIPRSNYPLPDPQERLNLPVRRDYPVPHLTQQIFFELKGADVTLTQNILEELLNYVGESGGIEPQPLLFHG